MEKNKLSSCPERIDDDDVKALEYFCRVSGTRKFCTYVLVYYHLKAASDPKLKIPRVPTLIKNIIPHDPAANNHLFFEEKDLTDFVCDSFIPSRKIEELDQKFTTMISSSYQIASIASDELEQVTIPLKKFKEWTTSAEMLKSAFISAKEENYTVEDEITRNRMVFQRLSTLVKKHGFTMGMNSLKSFTLPVTEYARSKNDHCLTHYDYHYKTEKINVGVIISASSSSTVRSEEILRLESLNLKTKDIRLTKLQLK